MLFHFTFSQNRNRESKPRLARRRNPFALVASATLSENFPFHFFAKPKKGIADFSRVGACCRGSGVKSGTSLFRKSEIDSA